ncbi:hypothetical protein DNTS_014986, partial [Danionella cerebrum]
SHCEGSSILQGPGASPVPTIHQRLKYLHSAGILHRDIKPGNLLVNSNCVLKICDFGLARVEEPDESRHMTQEVVTQYYRAPEILMGSRHYSNAIDIWSVGCIFAELLGRRILFQAQSPIQQLDLITDLLGTPSLEAMRTACEGARAHILRGPHKQDLGVGSVAPYSFAEKAIPCREQELQRKGCGPLLPALHRPDAWLLTKSTNTLTHTNMHLLDYRVDQLEQVLEAESPGFSGNPEL